MNKKELSELRRLYKPESSAVSRIVGCYVDADKHKKAVFKEMLLALDEEDVFKYLEILRKGISGSIGRSIVNVEYPLSAEGEGSMHERLMRLRETQLEDDGVLEDFYDAVIGGFEISGNYLILLSCAAYDIPGRGSDDITMEDASDEVYRFVQCVICPVELSKPALSYNEESRDFSHRIRDWVVGMPAYAWLFPAFNDRSTDIHAMLLYSKDVKDLRGEMVQSLFGCTAPLPACEQKNTFASVLETELGDELGLEAVRDISENLVQMKEETEESREIVEIGAGELKYLMKDMDISQERLEDLVNVYTDMTRESPILLDNVVSKKTFEVKTDSVCIKAAADRAYLISEQVIDGRKCIVIDTDGEQVEVNGVLVK